MKFFHKFAMPLILAIQFLFTQTLMAQFPAIVIHGGAGVIKKENMTPDKEKAYREKLEEALRSGYEILENGGTALDAVEKAIKILEDSPLFNAGKGSVLTAEGKAELDASIMDGKTLNAGAVAGVTCIKNPITCARAVMTKTNHVFLLSKGAEKFAKEAGLEIVKPSYFITEHRKEQLKKLQEQDKKTTQLDHKFGTVGCVALDKNGNLAAGTSTGGMTNKKFGRVGDSPIIGAGTYADNSTCGVSATGHGEFFIRSLTAFRVHTHMQMQGLDLKKAAEESIKFTGNLGGAGGIVALDKEGNIAMPFNTEGMFRGYINTQKELYVGIYGDE
jgi:beta-aspartyl-peptidase (threonine type)